MLPTVVVGILAVVWVTVVPGVVVAVTVVAGVVLSTVPEQEQIVTRQNIWYNFPLTFINEYYKIVFIPRAKAFKRTESSNPISPTLNLVQAN